ncbi:hypothetical protein PR003_g27444 [Phytophthora rubi]|uniref:RxLR effector protein n=1 Tax=Phytophthora rubi TaxID=129364 RepID=A0A6A3H6J2_9STRA|nr:hypothetical protein PR001_g28831 [Phytophthora rubi]KAE9282306.1 hypothetical protein PR003_g27444 [Phytophthora rubi]
MDSALVWAWVASALASASVSAGRCGESLHWLQQRQRLSNGCNGSAVVNADAAGEAGHTTRANNAVEPTHLTPKSMSSGEQ